MLSVSGTRRALGLRLLLTDVVGLVLVVPKQCSVIVLSLQVV